MAATQDGQCGPLSVVLCPLRMVAYRRSVDLWRHGHNTGWTVRTSVSCAVSPSNGSLPTICGPLAAWPDAGCTLCVAGADRNVRTSGAGPGNAPEVGTDDGTDYNYNNNNRRHDTTLYVSGIRRSPTLGPRARHDTTTLTSPPTSGVADKRCVSEQRGRVETATAGTVKHHNTRAGARARTHACTHAHTHTHARTHTHTHTH